jgi:hypothetical protein
MKATTIGMIVGLLAGNIAGAIGSRLYTDSKKTNIMIEPDAIVIEVRKIGWDGIKKEDIWLWTPLYYRKV